MCIEKRFPKSSHEVFNKIFQFLLKDQDARFMEAKIELMKKWLTVFWKRTENLEPGGVI